MDLKGNTILITGGASGIGLALAEAFHKLGNEVVIAGRRQEALEAATAANPGMRSLTLDIGSNQSIRSFAAALTAEYPKLNVLLNNAGIMRTEKLVAQQEDLADAEAIVSTNLLGPIRLTAALLPQLLKQPHATIVNVSSGLAFVPLAPTPTYCATKAAIHSYTQSLRYQLKGSPVEVIELIPPYVATDLMSGASDPRAMPLRDFIQEVMQIWGTEPTPTEICVERVKPMTTAAESGHYQEVFTKLNEAMADAH